MDKPFTKTALVADALNLGSHWVYNQNALKRQFPDGITIFSDPMTSYHGSKKAGDFTHTGDQLLFLHEAIQKNGGNYDESAWRSYWVDKMSSYDGYLDGASKTTLGSQGESPSPSDEVAGAARCAPIFDLDISLEETIQAVQSQTGLTHGSKELIELSEFITRSVFALKEGADFKSAFEKAALDGNYSALKPESHITKAEQADRSDHLKVASDFGLSCHFEDAFPLTLYYALHFGDNFKDCLSKNALAGGDNTARGLVLAILFAARDGDQSGDLYSELNKAL